MRLGLVVLLAACGGGASAPPIVDFAAPPNPNLAPSVWPIFHGDSWAQHSTSRPALAAGPIERQMVELDGVPVFVLFDGDEDILTVAKHVGAATLWKIDRETLTVVASAPLPPAATFAGAYGFLDAEGRAVLANGSSVLRASGTPDGTTLPIEASLDVAPSLLPGESLVAITPLYQGGFLVVGSNGTVGVLDPSLASQPVTTRFDGEGVYNGASVDEDGGIYVITDQALRRLAFADGALTVRWTYPVPARTETPRPGRLGLGSGTTPVLMMDDLVVIADDEDSMNLVVIRRADGSEVCKLPAFDGPSTTDNAVVVAGRTMVIEQNLENARGVARIDLDEAGRCTRTWVADVRGPSCVPTLSTGSGLAYVYTIEDGLWGLSGLDLESGDVAFFAPTDYGVLYDNLWAAVTVGPDARVYIGTLAGLQVFSSGR